MKKPLLDKITQLVEVDKKISFDSQNPNIYHQRALLLQELGCNFLAMDDNRICALLENREDIEYYNHQYQSLLTEEQFIKKFQQENHTHYYELLSYIIMAEKFLSSEKIDPVHFDLLAGNLLCLGLLNLSLRCSNDAIKYLQNYPKELSLAYLNKALLLNLVGEYNEGWKLYEHRWETNYESFANSLLSSFPKWNGERLKNKDILLIHSEQGIGDNIQFVRYAIYLKHKGVNVLVWNNTYIDDFLSFNLTRYGIPTVKHGDMVNFTYWIPMMSLPHFCGTTLQNIPLKDAYLTTSPESIEKWKSYFPVTFKRKIGVVWQGRRGAPNDKIRSIPLETFSKLFSVDAEFHVLQKDVNEKEVNYLAKYNNVHLWHSKLETFFDTAAIASQLDLIICVDTSVAHLTSALGIPTWILINYKPDFRWLLYRNDSVWYNSVKLFRQNLDYDWESVVQNVIFALNELITGKEQ